ncbi:DUF6054 family protein [Alicyclobacillus sp. SO9]|uniref:DUF6054 family protein n=1 Tax=Alicyclobacillus sp. SO9 TaxID=2665646 RepID=UPI0018E7536F|nr:DUF6054 family protein [Alicyclobacillus sp. SO9]QQE77415.1 hypothetical protein GI364_15835 [Alicyclobacillus sp. SO9]
MSKIVSQVDLSPSEALAKIKEELSADLVHEELHTPCVDKVIGSVIFEKYYFRSKNRAALVVTADNFQGFTEVRAVSTGSSEGMLFNFDWGAADNFVMQVERILEGHIVTQEDS